MNKNSFLATLILTFAFSIFAEAQTTANKANTSNSKKKINIDFENETVMGTYDVPDAQFINSRRMIKYKELFNKRTNFIEEIDSNKGLFNEYQK